ncbi:Hypothetical protein POVN_LOCUS5 [uncultured virus]|nr:Hypothetical protein POVN_LOCUS5 [uncultured virus]
MSAEKELDSKLTTYGQMEQLRNVFDLELERATEALDAAKGKLQKGEADHAALLGRLDRTRNELASMKPEVKQEGATEQNIDVTEHTPPFWHELNDVGQRYKVAQRELSDAYVLLSCALNMDKSTTDVKSVTCFCPTGIQRFYKAREDVTVAKDRAAAAADALKEAEGKYAASTLRFETLRKELYDLTSEQMASKAKLEKVRFTITELTSNVNALAERCAFQTEQTKLYYTYGVVPAKKAVDAQKEALEAMAMAAIVSKEDSDDVLVSVPLKYLRAYMKQAAT